MQPWDFFIIALSAIAIHRLWLREDIFAPMRRQVARIKSPWNKPLLCPPCFAFWAAVVAYAIRWCDNTYDDITWIHLGEVLAVYPLVRVAMALPSLMDRWTALPDPFLPTDDIDQHAREAGQRAINDYRAGKTMDTSLALEKKEDCPSCGKRKEDLHRLLRVRNRPALVLVTTLHDFPDSYSVVTSVRAQVSAAIDAGFQVYLLVQRNFPAGTLPREWADTEQFILVPAMPVFQWEPDEVNEDMAVAIEMLLRDLLEKIGEGTVITHDLLFQEWFLTHAKALHQLRVDGWTICHIAHSAPGKLKLTEDDPRRFRCTVPEGHTLISLSDSGAAPLASAYGTSPENVRVLPNGFDPLSFWNIHPQAKRLIENEALLETDIVQVYPLSLPRWEGKGLHNLIHILVAMRNIHQCTIRLVLANAHSTSELNAEVQSMAQNLGMADHELVLCSDYFDGDTPRTAVHDLMQASNLFILPSISEVCPFSVMEAAWCGALLVLNSNLPVLHDMISRKHALWFPFGKAGQPATPLEVDDVATRIYTAMMDEKVAGARSGILRKHGRHAIKRILNTLHDQAATHKSLACRLHGVTLSESADSEEETDG